MLQGVALLGEAVKRRVFAGGRAVFASALLLAGAWVLAGQAWGQSTPTHTFTLSSPAATIAEPASGTTFSAFTIQRDTSTELTGDIVITVSVAGSGANPASVEDLRDFRVINRFPVETVTFSGTAQMGTFRVQVASDNLSEPGETFTLSFSIATEHQAAVTANGGATLPDSHTVTITDNAADAISVSIAESNADADTTTTGTQVPEGRVALFTVTLSGGVSTAAVSVPYTITNTGAGNVQAADYTDAGGGTLSIPLSGGLAATTGVIRIALAIDADTTAENLTVTLGATASDYSASGTIARTGTAADQSATISVVSRPGAATRTLTVTAAAGPHPEGDANAPHTFTISFASGDTAFASDTAVNWSINHGGTNADDFTETTGVVTIPMSHVQHGRCGFHGHHCRRQCERGRRELRRIAHLAGRRHHDPTRQ